MVWEMKLFERPRHGGNYNIKADLKNEWGVSLWARCILLRKGTHTCLAVVDL